MGSVTPDSAARAVRDLESMGASEAEAYLQSSVEKIISVKGDIWNKRTKKDICIGLRTFLKKKKGFAAGTLPMCSLEEIEKASFILSKRAAPDPFWEHLPYPTPVVTPEGIYDKELASLSEEELLDKVQCMLDTAADLGSAECSLISRKETISVANTHGVEGTYNATRIHIGFSCTHGETEAVSSWNSRNIQVDVEELAEKTVQRALQAKKFSKIEDKFCGEAVFLPEVVEYMIAPCVQWSVHADNYYSEKSRFAGKKEDRVASSHITITDDGLLPQGICSAPFDGEGNPMQRTLLIEKGIFHNILHSEYTAHKYGEVSTGNALRTATGEPSVRGTNFIIKPDNYTLEELIEQVKKGVLVKDFRGDIDPSGGYFNGQAEGAYIENGEIKYSVKSFPMRGNVFDSLKTCELVGATQECSADGVYSVPLYISQITLG